MRLCHALLAPLLFLALPQARASAQPAAPAVAARAAKPKQPEPELPPAPLRVWLIAPSPTAPWTLRIDNEGERPARVAADVRLLSFEVEVPGDRRKRKKVRCEVPASMRPKAFPDRRALLLPPGHSYIEELDPRLLCFGKDAAVLAGGALVRSWLGWSPPSKWSRKPPSAPFMAESTDAPSAFAPARGLKAPPLVLSYAPPEGSAADKPAADKPASGAFPLDKPAADKPASGTAPSDKPAADKPASGTAPSDKPAADKPAADKPAADKPAADKPAADKPAAEGAPASGPTSDAPVEESSPEPIVDANAPRLELTAGLFSDASSPRAVSVRLKAENVGKRPMMVALRSRMLEFRVEGPDGVVVCDASPPTGSIPRDLYRTLKPGGVVDLHVLLKEVCPSEAFQREGLYHVRATLHANEPGTDLGLDGYTAVVPARNETLVRLRGAPQPFYGVPPRAVLTPKLSDPGAE